MCLGQIEFPNSLYGYEVYHASVLVLEIVAELVRMTGNGIRRGYVGSE